MLVFLPNLSQNEEDKARLQENRIDWPSLNEITDLILDYAEKFKSYKNSLPRPAKKPNAANDGTRKQISKSALSCRQKGFAIPTDS